MAYRTDAVAIGNDSHDLQRFCFKFEQLLQYKLKPKKSLLGSGVKKGDYWTLVLNLLANNRCFEDAIKYVKTVSEVGKNVVFATTEHSKFDDRS